MDIFLAIGPGSSLRWALVVAIFGLLIYQERHRVGWFHFGQELVIVVSAYFLYFGVRGLTEGGVQTATANAWELVQLEERLNLLHEADLQGLILGHQWMVDLANWVYIWGHWPVIAITAVWLYLHHPTAYSRTRDAILVSGAIGLVIFALYPVAPPRLIDAGLVDTVTLHSEAYRLLQPAALTNQFAAMPSLHFGWNLLIGLAIARNAPNPIARGFGAMLPVAMLMAVVLTGNHFIIDALVGGALAIMALAAVHWFHRTEQEPEFEVHGHLRWPGLSR